MEDSGYILLADLILIGHFALVCFVVIGALCIVGGRFLDWRWIYNSKFRIAHMLTIVVVALQALLGQLCPLTIWEAELRVRGGAVGYEQSFVQHWLHQVLFFTAPFWVFTTIYTIVAVIVVWLWLVDRKRRSLATD